MTEWVRQPSSAAVAEEFARRFQEMGGNGMDPCAVALTGGNSAKLFYDTLAARGVPSGVEFYWSDERVVPLDSPDSNYKLAADHLFRPAGVGAERLHPVSTDLGPEAAAAGYAATIRKNLGANESTTPRFPLIILGLGEDGHTGSLFPGRDPYQDSDRLVRAVEPTPDHPHPRITFTPKLINAADQVWFVITGKKKEWAVEQLEKRQASVRQVPSLTVDPNQTRLVIFRGED